MNTCFSISPDRTRIAYDVIGTGPAIILLHGGGSFRQEWHTAGYVERLQTAFQVITIDLRGHGESDQPENPTSYTPKKMSQDFLAVADACGVDHFTIWGFSYGGKAGRYLAVRSARVDKIILISTPFGPAIPGKTSQDVFDFCVHWSPSVQAQRDGTLDFASLSPEDQQLMRQCHVPAMLGWVPAMLDWPTVEPVEFRCPALWLLGSEDQEAMSTFETYKGRLNGSKVQVQVLEGLSHEGVFEAVDQVFDRMLTFTSSCGQSVSD